MRSSLLLCGVLLACTGTTEGAPDEVNDAEASDTSSMQETTTTSPPGDSAPVMEDTAPPLPSTGTFDGYWVWKEIVEGGAVKQTFTDEDMTWKVGASGWPGCPDGISCTKYGINVLYVSATRFHHMHRVTTGSDSQDYGSYTVKDGVITYEQVQSYSCAHPKNPSEYVRPATKYARFKKMGADLWITDFADKDPGAMASKWTVYRAITKADAHNKYDHPFCGEAREGGKCHCLCPSQDVLTDYMCVTK